MAEKKKKTAAAEETVSTAQFEEVKAELEKQKDLLLRTAAEFDNFKKRTERERASVAEYAKASIIKQLLPVFDNVDRAESCPKDSADYAKGIEMIVKQLNEVVTNLGITETGAVGDAFDPTVHEAVMHVEDDSVGDNTIVEVFQKGYRIGDTVIRPAMVKVAN